MNFNSVERVVEFLEMDQEAPTVTDVKPSPEVSDCNNACIIYMLTLP